MAQEENKENNSPFIHSNHSPYTTGRIITSLIVVVFILGILNYFHVVSLEKISPIFSLFPRQNKNQTYNGTGPTPTLTPLLSCAVARYHHDLLYTVATVGNITTGAYRGKIDTISIDQKKNKALFHIISKNGKESANLSVATDKTAFFDGINQTYLAVTDFKHGDSVQANFNCNPAKGNVFTIFSFGTIKQL